MLNRIVGVLVVLLAFGGCAYFGVQEMAAEQRVGGIPAVGLIFLIGPLLIVGWLGVRVGRLFIGRWQNDYLNRTLRERRLAGLGVAVLSGGALLLGVQFVVPSQHPGAELVAALRPACAGLPVPGGGVISAGAPINHLVVLGPVGNEQRWTGSPPMEWKPASLADTELVACVSDEDVDLLIETCHYINGPAIERLSATRHVKLVEPGSGRVVAEYDVTNTPRECHMTEEHDVTVLSAKVDWAMVQARLAGQLMPPTEPPAP